MDLSSLSALLILPGIYNEVYSLHHFERKDLYVMVIYGVHDPNVVKLLALHYE